MRVLACITVAILATGSARADTAAARVKAGEDFAKQGRLTEAIESFKAADKLEQRAKHACLIGLAYLRREKWSQAELFMAQCRERASRSTSDPLPDWAALAQKQLDDKLAKAKVAAVNIRVQPSDIGATIAVSTFLADETFSPRAIHLPRGKHVITATVAGKEPVSQTIEVTDESPREVVLEFAVQQPPPSDAVAPAPLARPVVTRQPPVSKGPSKRVPYGVAIAGGALLVTGAIVHATAYKSARDDLARASDGDAYDKLEGTFDSRRTLTIALYAAGAVTVATGLVLDRTVYRDRRPQLAIVPTQGGAVAVVGWRR